jgi:hypothetical protein
MPLNMMRHSPLIPFKFCTNRTYYNIYMLFLPPTTLLPPPLIRLLQRPKKPIIPRYNLTLIIKIVVLFSDIPLHPASPHTKSPASTTSGTVSSEIRTRSTDHTLPPLAFFDTDDSLHTAHPTIS